VAVSILALCEIYLTYSLMRLHGPPVQNRCSNVFDLNKSQKNVISGSSQVVMSQFQK
jgi:hypothetical protein